MTGPKSEPKAMTPQRVVAMEIHSRLTKLEDRIASFCPPGMTPQMVLHSVMIALQSNAKLLEASPDSVIMSAMQITQWGLQIGQTAYIIPYKGVATPVADYKGYIELMMATKLVKHVNAKAIRQADDFDYVEGDAPLITHRPSWQDKKSPIIGAYCSIPTTVGGVIQEVMNVDEIEAIRAGSHQWKGGALPEWYARKCPIRRATKYAPKSARLQQAMQFEDDFGNPSELGMDLMSGSPQAALGAGVAVTDTAPSYVKDPVGAPIANGNGYDFDDFAR